MIIEIPLDRIDSNPWQTRLGTPEAEYLQELAASIQNDGLLQNPGGRLVGTEELYTLDRMYRLDSWEAILADCPQVRVQLAFGHNRLAAYRLLNQQGEPWASLPVALRPLSDEQMATAAWAENEKRRDHTPLERAVAIERRLADFHWTHERVAEALGLSRSAVSNALRLLKLPADLRDDLQAGRVTERQAIALLPLFDVDPELARAHGFDGMTSVVVGMARTGSSSDELRSQANNALEWFKNRVQPSMIAAPAPQPAPGDPPEKIELRPSPGYEARLNDAMHAPTSAPRPVQPPAANPARPVAEAEAGGQNPPVPAADVEPVKALSWEESTIVVTITWWPETNGNRSKMIVGRVNQETPQMRMFPQGFDDLSDAMEHLMVDLKEAHTGKF